MQHNAPYEKNPLTANDRAPAPAFIPHPSCTNRRPQAIVTLGSRSKRQLNFPENLRVAENATALLQEEAEYQKLFERV